MQLDGSEPGATGQNKEKSGVRTGVCRHSMNFELATSFTIVLIGGNLSPVRCCFLFSNWRVVIRPELRYL